MPTTLNLTMGVLLLALGAAAGAYGVTYLPAFPLIATSPIEQPAHSQWYYMAHLDLARSRPGRM